MNNYCKKCRLRDGCIRKCKDAEIYEQGYCDGVSDGYKGAVDVLTPYEQQPKLITKIEGLKKIKMENKYKLWVARDWGGMLYAYFNKPIRDTVWKEWDSDKVSLSIDDSFFPELKWEDEPIEVELRPAITDLDTKAKEYANNVTDNEEIKELIINAYKAGYNE